MTGRFGFDLHTVTQDDSQEEATRTREDVREQCTTEEDPELVDQIIVDKSSEQTWRSPVSNGDLGAILRVFEESWMVSWKHVET